MKTSAVVSDTIGSFPSTIGEEKAAALDSIRRAQSEMSTPSSALSRALGTDIRALSAAQGREYSDATELMQDVFVRAWR
jgi:DNA-directed RNA polymerase specialized sigma24 family protein